MEADNKKLPPEKTRSDQPESKPAVTMDKVLSESTISSTISSPRKRLLDTRPSMTHKFNISGHEGYLIVGIYEDGRPGELFIKLAKEGSTLAGLADTIGILTSLCLQYGVPVETLANKLKETRYEPAGHTNNKEIPIASSLSDYIFRWLDMNFNDPE